MRVLSATISSAIYIGLLLFLFIFVYSILGMTLYRNKLKATNGLHKPYRQNFDDFIHSFFTIFQMMTVENWNQILTGCLNSKVNRAYTMFYLFSCQLILAYVLHNLFQAILLQGFEDPSILEDDDGNDMDEIKDQS